MPKTIDKIINVGTNVISLGDVYLSNSNGVSFGANGKTITASVSIAGEEYIFSNSNGISFGTVGSTVTASYTVPTNYISTNQSSLFQLTANNSLSLGTDYTSHNHSQYINTSQSSLFLTSQSGHSFSASGGVSEFQMLVFQNQNNGITFHNVVGELEVSHAFQYSSNTSNITQSALNTSQSILFELSSHTSAITSNALHSSISSAFLTSQTIQPFAVSGTNASSTFNTLQLGTENGLTLYLTNGSLVGSYTDGGGGGGDGLNRISAGTQIAGVTQTIVLSNSNNVSFGMSNNSVVTASASYSQPTDYVSTAQSSLFQQTSLMSNYLGTDYSSHTHSQYVNTSQSSLFEQSSHTTVFLTTQNGQAFSASGGSSTFQTLEFVNSNGFTFSNTNGSIRASYSVPTDYVSSNQSSLFALTANDSLSLGTTYTSHTHSQYLNTSQSSLFEQSSHTTVFLTTQSGQAYSAGNGSAVFQTLSIADSNGVSFSSGTQGLYATVRTNYASSDHSHGNPTLALTNLSGTTASNSAGFTLSLSVAPGGGGADGYNILAAGTQTANTTGTVVLSNSNGMSFGMNNSSIITASYTVPTDYVSTAQSSLFLYTSQSSLFEHTSHTTIFLTTQSGQAFSAGAASSVFQTLSFQDSNGVSFSNNAGAIRVSHDLQFTSNTSAITSNALNTSQSSLFQHTSATSAITSNALHTSVSRVINIVAATNNTGGGTASLSSNVSFSNANGMSFYTSAGGAIVGSYSVPTLTNSSLTMQAGASTLSSVSRIAFVDSNGVSFGASTSNNGSITITATVATTYAASNHSHGNPTLALTNLTGTTASASNGFTLSLSAAAPGGGGGIVLANSQTTYTSGTVHLSGAGAITIASTTGQSYQISVPATSSLSATGIISLSTNGSTVSIGASQSNQIMTMYATSNTTQSSTGTQNASSMIFVGAGAASVGISNGSVVISAPNAGAGNVTISAGTASAGLASLVFSNSNGVSFGLNGSTITASAAGGGGGIALANSQTTYTSGTAHLSGAGAITVASTTGQSYIISAPGSSSISGTGQVSISVNGSTISIGVPSALTVSRYNEFKESPMVAGEIGQASLHIQPWLIPNLHMDRIVLHKAFSNASNSSNSFTVSDWVGIYTQNVSTLSLLHSVSYSTNFTGSGTAGSYLSYGGGIKAVTIGLTQTLTEGMYWVGIIQRTTTGGGAGHTLNQVLNSQMNSSYRGIMGAATTVTAQMSLGFGVYSATTSAMPASVAFTQINGNSSVYLRPPSVYFVSGTI